MSDFHEENVITFTVVDSIEKNTHCCGLSTDTYSYRAVSIIFMIRNGCSTKIAIEGIPFDVHYRNFYFITS